ncbi:MAG: ABC transporter permease [Bdellovibrionaceae bacterium]|nr:ABC transporter permease [Pseudobdellovibrionaceae bacterium]MDW8189676.1 FtsX-like permease family protein [Pseudobdellovibrionaceae bacterium]
MFKLSLYFSLIWSWLKSEKGSAVSFVTWLPLVGLILGISSLIVAMSVVAGFEETLYESVARVNGHLHIKKNFKDRQEFYQFRDRLIEQYPDQIISVRPLLIIEGLAVVKGRVEGSLLHGIDMQEAPDFLTMQFPNLLKLRHNEVALGQGLAQKLGVTVGQFVHLLVPIDNVEGVHQFRREYRTYQVAQVLHLGKHEYDERVVLMHLNELQNLSQTSQHISAALIGTRDRQWAQEMKMEIQRFLGIKYKVYSWYDINSYLFESIKIERIGIFVIIFIIVIASAFNAGISLWISVIKKTQQMSLLRVLGMSHHRVKLLMLLFGGAISLMSFILGLPLGVLLSYGFDWLHTEFNLLPGSVYKIDHLVTKIRLVDVLVIFTSQFVLSLLAAYWPAHWATRFRIVEGLRFE